MKQFLVVLLLILASQTKIIRLDESNLKGFTRDNSFWLIQVAKPVCPECKAHENELESLAIIFQGVVKIGKIDESLLPKTKNTRNPTYIFGRANDPDNIRMFQEDFNSQKLSKFISLQLQKFLDLRIDTAFKKEGQAFDDDHQGHYDGKPKKKLTVVELTDTSFDQKVLKSRQAWFVSFYSPSCGHCKSLEPEYFKLPKMIGKRVNIARVDGTSNRNLMQKYKIKGFPTIYLFGRNHKHKPVPYEGERKAQAILAWLDKQDIEEDKMEILEFNRQVYSQECRGNIICFVFILEHAHDDQGLSRVQKMLTGQPIKGPFKFFSAGRLAKLETNLMIEDRSCPKLVTFWHDLNSYRLYRGKLNPQDFREFLRDITDRKKWIKMHEPLMKAIFGVAETPETDQF